MLKNNTKIIVGSIFIWLFLVLYPWQGWFSSLAAFRFVIGLIIFIIPGTLTFLYINDDKNISARVLLGGFLASIFVTGLLGLFARLFHSNILLIRWGFILWGVVALILFAAYREKVTWQFEKFTWLDAVMLLAAAGGVIYFAGIANPPLIHDDAFTYNALLFYYQHAPALDFAFPSALSRLEIPRFWIAYWPLVEAMISDFSRVDGLIIAGAYLPPALACFSFLGIYSLGRTLGLPRAAAGAAVLAQGFSLMRLTQLSQPGNLFFQRLTEDKVVAAFVISLILILLVIEYLERPNLRKLILVGVAAFAMVFTHPVQFGMTCMIIGVYGLPSLFNNKIRANYFALLGILAMIVLIPYLFRFGGGEYSQSLSFSIKDVARNDDFARLGGRIEIIDGTQFYGISKTITPGLPFKVGLLASIISLFVFWKYKFARYILSAFLVLGMSMFPYTGWIVGMFTTPFQLWRIAWLMPFGLAFAFLIWAGFELAQKIKIVRLWGKWSYSLYYFSAYIGLIAALILVRPWALGNVETRNLDEVGIYKDYLSVADFMNDLPVDKPVFVGGPDAVTNSIIPRLPMNFEPLFFRVEIDSKSRKYWESMVGEENTPVEERYAAFMENKVEYLLLKGRPEWLVELSRKYPDLVSLLFREGKFSLYKITP